MASSTLFPLCVAVYILSFFFTTSLSATSASEKVKVDLYYETLCPGCSDFMVKELPKIFSNGLIKFVDLNLVPFGNARLEENGNITCQHGEYECKLNMVEACAINAWPDTYKHYSFIYCVEELVVRNKYTEWESCYNKAGYGYDPKLITDCLNSPLGKQLEKGHANETASLQPPHQFVPWVVVNDQPLKEPVGDFKSAICGSLRGTLPEACNQIPSHVPTVEEHRNNQVQFCSVE